jgi:hypothetical protein
LLVRAKYSDGRIKDVTELAEFASNDKEVAKVDEFGMVKVGNLSGEGVVLARFMGLLTSHASQCRQTNSCLTHCMRVSQ